MGTISRLLVVALVAAVRQAYAQQLVDPTSKDNSPDCGCYIASGPDPGFFQYHRFWDFRSVANAGDDDFTTAPALITADQMNGTEPLTSSFFNSSQFQADWQALGDVERLNSTYRTVNSPQNIYISRNSTEGANSSTFLTLRTSRLQDFMSTAELDSKQSNVLHSSIRARFRVVPNGLSNSSAPASGVTKVDNADTGSNAGHPVDEGAVVGFFTYLDDTQESDIEILTTEPTSFIHYSNQPDYDNDADMPVPDASTNATLPAGLAYTDWLEHRLDWFDGMSRYWVNDQLLVNKTKNVPTAPSRLILNVWSDGGSWSGNMSVGGQVTMAVEWVEMVFNVSGDLDNNGGSGSSSSSSKKMMKRDDSGCHTACKIDGVQKVGFPEKISLASITSSPSSPSSSGSSASPSTTAKSMGISFLKGTGVGRLSAYGLPIVVLFVMYTL